MEEMTVATKIEARRGTNDHSQDLAEQAEFSPNGDERRTVMEGEKNRGKKATSKARSSPRAKTKRKTKPATGSGPHSIPTSADAILREWEHVLKKLESVSVALTGAFEPMRVLKWTADALELGIPSQFEANKDLAESNFDALRKVLQADYAQSPKITIAVLDAAESTSSQSVLEATRERTSAERDKRVAEAAVSCQLIDSSRGRGGE